MSRNKTLLSFLLMLCIGLAPVQVFAAGESGQMDSMPQGCVDCDMHEDGGKASCDEPHCLMSAEYCGSHNVASILQRPLTSPVPSLSLIGYRQFEVSRYRSRQNFSIYRPPIA